MALSPKLGDIHALANACDDQASISIHVYGGNIGRIHRWIYDPADGSSKGFVSGYFNDAIPNLWGGISVTTVTAETLRGWWRSGREVALFDMREEGPYSLAHPFFAVSLPIAQIALRIEALVPRRSVPVVVYDNGEGLAARRAARIAGLGSTDVAILEGGLAAYRAVGEVFRDVNVPSKAFGEVVESIRHTPSLPPESVLLMIEQEPDLVVLEGGNQASRAGGFGLDASQHHWGTAPEDVYIRPYEGTGNRAEAMQAYIDWELQLVAQLANDGVSRFHVVRA